jgi:hypothetical protein
MPPNVRIATVNTNTGSSIGDSILIIMVLGDLTRAVRGREPSVRQRRTQPIDPSQGNWLLSSQALGALRGTGTSGTNKPVTLVRPRLYKIAHSVRALEKSSTTELKMSLCG